MRVYMRAKVHPVFGPQVAQKLQPLSQCKQGSPKSMANLLIGTAFGFPTGLRIQKQHSTCTFDSDVLNHDGCLATEMTTSMHPDSNLEQRPSSSTPRASCTFDA